MRTLQTHQKPLGVFPGAAMVGYSGLAVAASGCGGLQCLELARYPVQEVIGSIALESVVSTAVETTQAN